MVGFMQDVTSALGGDLRPSLLGETLHRFGSGTALEAVRELRDELAFPKRPNAVRGKFASFAEALRSVPHDAVVGFDAPAYASLYDDRLDRLDLTDYPVALWFSRAVSETKKVFDLGGHKGHLYYGLAAKFPLPSALEWLVCDVATTVREGRALATKRGAFGLEFTTGWHEGDGANLVIASGVLQYLDWSLLDCIEAFREKPRIVLVNSTPLYDGPTYVTLQNIGLGYHPYRVFNEKAFLLGFEKLGYKLVDRWRTPRSLHVPLHPELTVGAYQGFALELRS